MGFYITWKKDRLERKSREKLNIRDDGLPSKMSQ